MHNSIGPLTRKDSKKKPISTAEIPVNCVPGLVFNLNTKKSPRNTKARVTHVLP